MPTDSLERIPPQDLEAEMACLGAILQDGRMLEKVCEDLLPGDFYRYGAIYEIMLDLRARDMPVDQITVFAEIKKREIGWSMLDLHNLINFAPSPQYAEPYARIVKEQSLRRKLLQAGYEIAALAQSEMPEAELEDAATRILGIATRSQKRHEESVLDALRAVTNEIDAAYDSGGRLPGLSTGFWKLDAKTGGMLPGQLIVIGAATGLGKSSLAMNIAANVCRQGRGVAVFSLEMDKRQIIHRLLCSEARVNAHNAMCGKIDPAEHKAISEAANRLFEWPLEIQTVPTNALTIRSSCRKLSQEGKLSVVIVDYLQLMDAHKKADTRTREVSDMAHALKQIAMELGIPVIALSQVGRAVGDRARKIPTKSDLRESGDIENDADQIWLLYSENYYKRHQSEIVTGDSDVAELIIAKNRSGEEGTIVKLVHHPRWTRFDSLASSEQGNGLGMDDG